MKKNIIYFTFLLILFHATLVFADRNPFRVQLPEPPVSEEAPIEEEPTTPINYPSTKESTYDQTSRDYQTPSRTIAPVVQPPELTITGVIWNTNRPQAIINGLVVDVGDNIPLGRNSGSSDRDGTSPKVVSIAKASIEIEYKGQNFQLTP